MIRNTRDSWGWPARALHWVVALMVLGLFADGLLIDELPRDGRLFQIWLHCAVGITALLIAGVGFLWWLANVVPAEPAGTPQWQGRSAKLVHWALYALIFAITLTGWALTGAMRQPVSIDLFGFIGVPQLVPAGSADHRLLEEAHELLAYGVVALALLHAGAALYHHFVRRDAVLLRMLGRRRNDSA